MHDIHISDPAWRTTFPYLVAPLPNEWIAGVLLRCDERKGISGAVGLPWDMSYAQEVSNQP